ncbi:hypothetical protein ACJMK2_036395 [Sinanodonta woodiana]|uniref:Ammonium transporter n=1 Tax=Sinanodonta woodiana TaxID=1069815 RepID=A0ABD3WH28_SINWO
MGTLDDNMDQFFLIITGMCIIFMQSGFAFLEAGAVRSKNVTNILIKNVFDSFIAGIAYWTVGYAFAYGEGNDFIGWKYFASSELPDNRYAFFFFQYTFAATSSTIVSGALAERCEFIAYFIYSFFITGFIYPLVTHWTWAGGFLFKGVDYGGDIGQIGYRDFSGSGVVHVVGGVASFVGAAMVGPRIGRFHKITKTTALIRGHSVPIAALGGFILFFGFLAFNGGSQITIHNEGDGAAVSISVVNTFISASFAAFTAFFINRIHIFGNSSWSLLCTINGSLAGMVAVCAGCNVYYPWGACIVGTGAAVSYHFWSFVVRSLHVDDPLDAVAVHFGGGTCGVIAVAFLDKHNGIVFNWNPKSGLFLAWQLAGLATIIGWTAAWSLLLFGIMKLLKILRVPEELELKGLDIPKHNEPAYPVEAYGHGHIEKIIQILENTPIEVTQGYQNVAFVLQELDDKGPYEHPEVKAALKKSSSVTKF